jgi:hypothetical protein
VTRADVTQVSTSRNPRCGHAMPDNKSVATFSVAAALRREPTAPSCTWDGFGCATALTSSVTIWPSPVEQSDMEFLTGFVSNRALCRKGERRHGIAESMVPQPPHIEDWGKEKSIKFAIAHFYTIREWWSRKKKKKTSTE